MSPQFRRSLALIVILGACRPRGAVEASAGEQRFAAAEADAARRADTALIRELDDKIADLEQLAIRLEGHPERPDYMMKLANAYSDKKDYFKGLVEVADANMVEARRAGDETMAAQYAQERDEYSRIVLASCVRSYRVLIALTRDIDYVRYEHMDEALVRLAVEASDLGEVYVSQVTYQRLLNDYPRSRHVPKAYLAFADYYFDKGWFANAVRLYHRVVAHEDRSLHAYALYKLGCSHAHPLGEDEARHDESLRYFVEAIQATREHGRTRSEAEAKQLRRLARLGLVQPYSHVGSPAEASAFFIDVGRGPAPDEDETREMMELLAAAYASLEKWDASTTVYKSLQDRFEADADVCEWQRLIIENARMNGDAQQLRAEQQNYAKTCECSTSSPACW